MLPLSQKYSNVHYIRHEKNKNGSAARNTGFKSSSGEFVMFLDDDDEFLSKKIEEQVKFLSSHDKTYGACYTHYVDKRDRRIVSTSYETKDGDLLVDVLARNLFIHAGSNFRIRREVVEGINGFDESFRRNQDVEFLVRIFKKYKLGYVNQLGLVVYVHEKNYGVDYFDLTEQYLNKFGSVTIYS